MLAMIIIIVAMEAIVVIGKDITEVHTQDYIDQSLISCKEASKGQYPKFMGDLACKIHIKVVLGTYCYRLALVLAYYHQRVRSLASGIYYLFRQLLVWNHSGSF